MSVTLAPAFRKHVIYEELYDIIQVVHVKWQLGKEYRQFYAGLFYQCVCAAGLRKTQYQTLGAAQRLPATDDHCFSPRLVFRAAMDQCPEIIADRDEFYNLMDLCRITVRVTKKQNIDVKFEDTDFGLPIVRALTYNKYDNFGWVAKKCGLLQEKHDGKLVNSPFPLKQLIPDWFTAFEQKCMKEHGY
jgi:hypothetical protein